MPDESRVLVIIPAWNEAASVGAVVRNVLAVPGLPNLEVLVVDDGSEDGTAEVARAAGAHVLRLPYNLGVGGAMRLGYRFAHDGGYDVAIQVDADGQHDPAYLPPMLDLLRHHDLVIGSRFAGEGDYSVKGPRQWAMAILAWFISLLARTRIDDTTSGFRGCNRTLIGVFARRYPTEYLGDTVETLVYVVRRGYRVTQLPVAMRRRATGRPSQSSLRASLYLGRAILALLLALLRK